MPKRVEEKEIGKKERFLLYGEPKTGKTFAAHTAPGPIYTIVLGDEEEIDTVRGPDFKDKYPEKEIYYDYVLEERGKGGIFKSADAFDEASMLLDKAIEMRESGELPFQTLVIDNVTVLSEYAMNKAMELGPSGSGKASKALKKLRDNNIFVPADYDYKSEMSLTEQFVLWATRLPFHVVFVAHEYKEWETEDSESRHSKKLVSILPLFTGRLRTRMPGKFSNVWHFHAEGSSKARSFYAQTSGSSKPDIIAGTRIGGVLPFKWRDPNLTEAIEKLRKAAS